MDVLTTIWVVRPRFGIRRRLPFRAPHRVINRPPTVSGAWLGSRVPLLNAVFVTIRVLDGTDFVAFVQPLAARPKIWLWILFPCGASVVWVDFVSHMFRFRCPFALSLWQVLGIGICVIFIRIRYGLIVVIRVLPPPTPTVQFLVPRPNLPPVW